MTNKDFNELAYIAINTVNDGRTLEERISEMLCNLYEEGYEQGYNEGYNESWEDICLANIDESLANEEAT